LIKHFQVEINDVTHLKIKKKNILISFIYVYFKLLPTNANLHHYHKSESLNKERDMLFCCGKNLYLRTSLYPFRYLLMSDLT